MSPAFQDARCGLAEAEVAAWIERDGQRLPARYVDVRDEYSAATCDAALCHRGWRTAVEIRGGERAIFLHRLLTNDVVGVSAGDGTRALLLNGKGKVVADIDLWMDPEVIHATMDAVVVEPALTLLRRYVLRSLVSFTERQEDEIVFGLVGPAFEEVLANLDVAPPPEGARTHTNVSIGGVTVRSARTPCLTTPGVELYVPCSGADRVWSLLRQTRPGRGLMPLGWEASEVLRVEAGLAAFGAELTGSELPQEALLEDAVDYEKGCYLGQETVARLHYRGHVNRLLVGLRFSSMVPSGASLWKDREVGRVTSAVVSPRHGPIGLGYVRRQHAAPGQTLKTFVTDDLGSDTAVVSLPFSDDR